MIDPRFSIGESTCARKLLGLGRAVIGVTTLFAISLNGCTSREHDKDMLEHPSAIGQLAVRRVNPDPLVEAPSRGRKVYEHYCQICHGPEAQGNGFNAAMLDPPPRNFADETFWKQTDDEHLLAVITTGGKAVGKTVLMPPWGRTLDETQIRDVIAFLRTVPERVRQTEKPEESASSE